MTQLVTRSLDRLLGITGLQYLPVRVRAGIATGARWTLYPWSAYWRGTQEPELHRTLSGLGDIRGWTCWDLGAHFGIYSLGLARLVGAAGQVAAFEPNPTSFARLERHRRMNGLDWMVTFEAAVSDRSGQADLLTYGDLRSTTTHLAYEGEAGGPDTRPLGVRTVVLDELVASGQLRAPDFIKVDVEGHAHKALTGARQALRAKRPILVVALHSQAETDGVIGLLTPLGYTHSVIGEQTGYTGTLIGRDLMFRPTLAPAGP